MLRFAIFPFHTKARVQFKNKGDIIAENLTILPQNARQDKTGYGCKTKQIENFCLYNEKTPVNFSVNSWL